jgi:hypothetical protein
LKVPPAGTCARGLGNACERLSYAPEAAFAPVDAPVGNGTTTPALAGEVALELRGIGGQLAAELVRVAAPDRVPGVAHVAAARASLIPAALEARAWGRSARRTALARDRAAELSWP